MTRSMADLESASPFYEGGYFQNPVFPVTERNACRDEVVREGELMVKEMEEDAQKCSHKGVKKGFDRSQTLT